MGLPAVNGGSAQAAAVVARPTRISEGGMKARITDDGRFLGLDFADWSMLLVGLTLAGYLALSI
jgi:hypothetical protein